MSRNLTAVAEILGNFTVLESGHHVSCAASNHLFMSSFIYF